MEPQDNDEAIEQVEAVLNVAEEAFGDHLEKHLDSEQRAEEQVAVLEHHCQRHRLSTSASSLSKRPTTNIQTTVITLILSMFLLLSLSSSLLLSLSSFYHHHFMLCAIGLYMRSTNGSVTLCGIRRHCSVTGLEQPLVRSS